MDKRYINLTIIIIIIIIMYEENRFWSLNYWSFVCLQILCFVDLKKKNL
jgi:hypothetical protein